MKTLFKIFSLTAVAATMTLSSCNFLDIDNYFEGTFKQDSIFHSKKNAEAYLWNTPTRFPDPGAIFGFSWNLGTIGSDEMMVRWRKDEFWPMMFATGEINERNLKNADIWPKMYTIINRCNTMLANVDKVTDMTAFDRRVYTSYVHFMRGYAYYHLLMNWGPLLIVGDEVMNTSEPAAYYDRERATFDESIDYICAEMGEALKGMNEPQNQGINLYERPTKGAALALIARLRLYQASPAFNGGDAARRSFGNWKRKSDGKYYVSQTYDPQRWAVAAAAAKQVIDMNYYKLHIVPADQQTTYSLPSNVSKANYPEGVGGIDPLRSFTDMFNGESPIQTNPEFIWAMPSGQVSSYTKHCFPVKMGGWGGFSVPQRVVDCFLMADGRTIHNASTEYPYDADLEHRTESATNMGYYTLPAGVPNMYKNREPRFYATIGFPGRVWPMNSASSDGSYINQTFWYDFNDGVAGFKAATDNPEDFNVTGYTSVKYIHPDDSWANGKGSVKGAFITGPKPFPIFRYSEVLLNFIEAMNLIEGPTTVKTYDLAGDLVDVTIDRDVEQMRKAFNLIRYRVGLPGPIDEELASAEKLNEIVRNERQIELFAEGFRFFDTRRWGTYLDNDANSNNWRGLDVFKERDNSNGNEGFWNVVTIDLQNIRDRLARPKMIFLPLPHNELLKVPAMDQNPGWDR